jgi:ABC-type transport system substrate-binding protein
MPFFCPVPPSTPTLLASLDPRPPDSGPYMRLPTGPTPLATGDISLTLVRNPYYTGTRPRNPAQIDFVYIDPADNATYYTGVRDGLYDLTLGFASAADVSAAGRVGARQRKRRTGPAAVPRRTG